MRYENATDREEATGDSRRFPFPSSFQFRTDEKATLEAFFESIFFDETLNESALAAMDRIRPEAVTASETVVREAVVGGVAASVEATSVEAAAAEAVSEEDDGASTGRDPDSSGNDTESVEADAEARYALLFRGADGIGKTRIFRHLRERARARKVSVYEIHHYDVEGIPLKPFLHTIRRILVDLDDPVRVRAGTALLDRYRYALERLIPEAFGLDRAEVSPCEPRLDRLDVEKVRIFDGIASLLLEVTTQKPLLILVHDLHRADRATVDLLRYIGRNVHLRNRGALSVPRSDDAASEDNDGAHSGATASVPPEISGPEFEDFSDGWRGLGDSSAAWTERSAAWANRSGSGTPSERPESRGAVGGEPAETSRPSRLMLLANYRADDDPASYVRQGIENLVEEPFVFHAELRPLRRQEAERFVELSVEGVEVDGRSLEVSDDGIDALWDASEGFPSFQQELFRGLHLTEKELSCWTAQTFADYLGAVDTGTGASDQNEPVRSRILQRRIDEYARQAGGDGGSEAASPGGEIEVLRVLALARRPVDEELVIRALSEHPGENMAAAVRRSIARLVDDGVVEQNSDGLHHFRLWDYTRVVERLVDESTRRAIHQRIGELRRERLESTERSDQRSAEGAYEVYYHLSRGEQPVSACEFGETAATLFQRSFAFGKAKSLYAELVEILAGDEHLVSRRHVLKGLARAAATLHEYEAADAVFKRIYQEAGATLEHAERLEILLLEAEIAGAVDSGRALKVLGKAPKLLPDDASPEGLRLYRLITRLRLSRQDWKRAINYALKGVSIAQKLENGPETARFFQLLARTFYRKGDYTHAVDNYQRALETAEQLDESALTVDILDDLGRVYLERGNYFRAARYLYKALEMRQRDKDVAGLCRSYDQLALVYRRDGDYHKTIENLQRSLKLKERVGDFAGLNPTLGTLGDLYMRLGSYQLAIDCFQKEVENSRRLEESDVEATGGLSDAFVRLGRVYYEVGDLKQAASLCKQVLILAPEYKLRSQEADGMLLDGNLRALSRDWAAAEKSLKQASEAYGKLGHRIRETCALLDLAEVKLQRELYGEALKIASKAQIIADDVKALDLRVRALTIKGNVHRFLKGGNPEKVKELLAKALEMSQHLSDVTVLFQVLYSLAKVFHNDREFSEASNCYGKAEAILKRIGTSLADDLQARYFKDPRRKIFAEDAARFRKESQGRMAVSDARERMVGPADLREPPVSSENYKGLLDRILRVNLAMNQLHFSDGILLEGLELAKAERGFVMLVTNREYSIVAARGFGKDIRQHPEHGAVSQLSEDAIRKGRTFLPQSGDERRSHRLAPFDLFSSRSVIVVPLMTDDRIFGALFLDRHLSLGRFANNDQLLLEAFARHAGVALQNRRNLDVAIREPVTGFLTPSYFIDRLRDEYRLFNLHGRSFALAGFYLPVLEDAVGEERGGLGKKLGEKIEEVCRGVAVCWGNPVLFVLFRDTDLSVAEEMTMRVNDRLEDALGEEVSSHVLAADRRHQRGSDIYYEIRRKLLPEECDLKTLTELRRLLAKDIKLKDAKRILEKHIIESTLRKTGGNITHAARELGIHRPQLSNYLKKYGLKRERYETGFETGRILPNPMEN